MFLWRGYLQQTERKKDNPFITKRPDILSLLEANIESLLRAGPRLNFFFIIITHVTPNLTFFDIYASISLAQSTPPPPTPRPPPMPNIDPTQNQFNNFGKLSIQNETCSVFNLKPDKRSTRTLTLATARVVQLNN